MRNNNIFIKLHNFLKSFYLEKINQLIITYLSLLLLDMHLRIPGTMHKQFVSTTAWAESNCGKAKKAKTASPATCNVSITATKKNSLNGGLREDLKQTTRKDLKKVPTISGTAKPKIKAHTQATCKALRNLWFRLRYRIWYCSQDCMLLFKDRKRLLLKVSKQRI